jgi:uncharacterized protein
MRSGHLPSAVVGLALGFSLSWMGFADFREVHNMFTFSDLRLLFTFFAGVALTGLGFLVVARGQKLMPKPIHKGTILGGILFGVGWAVTGACPGAALVQLGEGQLPALITITGIVIGTLLYRKVHARFFRWDRGACED